MTDYMDVGVTRIQEYINRTTGSDEGVLRKRRGASTAVADATDVVALAVQLARHGISIQENSETYDTEGVAHLVISDAGGRTLDGVADTVLSIMRAQLPGAYLEASWAEGPTYADAVDELRSQREEGRSLVWLPLHRDEVLSARCRSCGLGVVERGKECSDCSQRDDKGQRGTSRAEVFLTSELRLRTARDFGELARLPRKAGLSVKVNHLATLYADGNGVGALFQQIHGHPALARELSEILDTATKQATTAAIEALNPTAVLPALPSVVAADDIIVTLPAVWAWPFTLHLHRAFADGVAAHLADASPQLRTVTQNLPWPTLSSGLVFAHYKHPIELATRRSADCLREAKKSVSGKEAVICWTDLTQESDTRSWPKRPLAWFDKHHTDLTELADLATTKRKYYERAIRVLAEDPHLRVEYLRKDSRRTGCSGSVEPFLYDDDTDELRDALTIADWWLA